MSLSFRTNGNFIDFVNTDATSLNVENVIMSLHNTSRAVSWSLPADTTKISFTIDDLSYDNIPITSIDFDGTVMNSQDDFETGITEMFPGLANEGGSGGGVESVTYQNSAMSSPVMAFVFKDADDNIYRVYEPIRNNDVSRSQFAYADSIDKFPFDNTTWYNNTFSDVKLLNMHASNVFRNNTIENIVINTLGAGTNPLLISAVNQGTKTFTIDASFGDRYELIRRGIIVISGSTGNDGVYNVASADVSGSNETLITVTESIPSSVADGGLSGFQLIGYTQKGGFGFATLHGAEVYITGDMVKLSGNICGGGSFDGSAYATQFDSIGDYSFIANNNFDNKVLLQAGDKTFRYFTGNKLTPTTIISLSDDLSYCTLNTFLSCQVVINSDPTVDGDIYSGLNNNQFNQESVINISKQISSTSIGVAASVNSANGKITNSDIGANASYSPSSDKNNVNILRIGATTFEMGEDTGAAILTAV